MDTHRWYIQLFNLQNEDIQPIQYVRHHLDDHNEEEDVVGEDAVPQPGLVLRADLVVVGYPFAVQEVHAVGTGNVPAPAGHGRKGRRGRTNATRRRRRGRVVSVGKVARGVVSFRFGGEAHLVRAIDSEHHVHGGPINRNLGPRTRDICLQRKPKKKDENCKRTIDPSFIILSNHQSQRNLFKSNADHAFLLEEKTLSGLNTQFYTTTKRLFFLFQPSTRASFSPLRRFLPGTSIFTSSRGRPFFTAYSIARTSGRESCFQTKLVILQFSVPPTRPTLPHLRKN